MIHVLETWELKDDYADRVPELMQKMDNLVGPRAHEHPAFLGHATFYQHEHQATKVWVMYPWRSREEAEELISGEASLISEFEETYCAAPREISYLTEVPHEHDHDDDHEHEH